MDYFNLHRMSYLLQTVYPERIHRILIYPAGTLFSLVWKVAKWFLDVNTRQNTVVCRKLEEVRAHVRDEFIPTDMVSYCLVCRTNVWLRYVCL